MRRKLASEDVEIDAVNVRNFAEIDGAEIKQDGVSAERRWLGWTLEQALGVPAREVGGDESEVFVKRGVGEVAEQRAGGEIEDSKIEVFWFLVWGHWGCLPCFQFY
jgi:hypothetical protein